MTKEQILDYKDGYPIIWKQGRKRTQLTFIKSNLLMMLECYNYGCQLIHFDELEKPTKKDYEKAIEEENSRHHNSMAHINAVYKNLGVIGQ